MIKSERVSNNLNISRHICESCQTSKMLDVKLQEQNVQRAISCHSQSEVLLKSCCFVYLVRPDWPDCKLPPVCPSSPRSSSHLPAMKGSPVRTTSEPGWKYESSLKGRIELLHRGGERAREAKKREMKRSRESKRRR